MRYIFKCFWTQGISLRLPFQEISRQTSLCNARTKAERPRIKIPVPESGLVGTPLSLRYLPRAVWAFDLPSPTQLLLECKSLRTSSGMKLAGAKLKQRKAPTPPQPRKGILNMETGRETDMLVGLGQQGPNGPLRPLF